MDFAIIDEGLRQELGVRMITGPAAYDKTFTVCTLLRRDSSYDRALASFRANGFSAANTNFVALDNRVSNAFDGFQMVRRMVTDLRSRYIVFCHDDIEVRDNFDMLAARLEALEARDPRWCVCGVAGGRFHGGNWNGKQLSLYISDIYGQQRRSPRPLPERVESVDECFFIMPRERVGVSSLDLSGFHFFGADVCLQAEMAGGTCYVIDFHIMHYGEARRGTTFTQGYKAIARKYRRYMPTRNLHTTTEVIRMKGTPVAWVNAQVYETWRRANKLAMRFGRAVRKVK